MYVCKILEDSNNIKSLLCHQISKLKVWENVLITLKWSSILKEERFARRMTILRLKNIYTL